MLGLETWDTAVCAYVSRPAFVVNAMRGSGFLSHGTEAGCCKDTSHIGLGFPSGPFMRNEVGKVAWVSSQATGTWNHSYDSQRRESVTVLLKKQSDSIENRDSFWHSREGDFNIIAYLMELGRVWKSSQKRRRMLTVCQVGSGTSSLLVWMAFPSLVQLLWLGLL